MESKSSSNISEKSRLIKLLFSDFVESCKEGVEKALIFTDNVARDENKAQLFIPGYLLFSLDTFVRFKKSFFRECELERKKGSDTKEEFYGKKFESIVKEIRDAKDEKEKLEVIDKYFRFACLGKKLGKGGQASVMDLVKIDSKKGRPLAIKFLTCYLENKEDEGGLYKIISEIEFNALKSVSEHNAQSPQELSINIPIIKGIQRTQEDVVFIIFRKIDGCDLEDFFKQDSNKDRDHDILLRDVFNKAGLSLSNMHKYGLAHGDIKLGNLMIDKNNDVYLIDLGFVRDIKESVDLKSVTLSVLPLQLAIIFLQKRDNMLIDKYGSEYKQKDMYFSNLIKKLYNNIPTFLKFIEGYIEEADYLTVNREFYNYITDYAKDSSIVLASYSRQYCDEYAMIVSFVKAHFLLNGVIQEDIESNLFDFRKALDMYNSKELHEIYSNLCGLKNQKYETGIGIAIETKLKDAEKLDDVLQFIYDYATQSLCNVNIEKNNKTVKNFQIIEKQIKENTSAINKDISLLDPHDFDQQNKKR